MKTKINWNKTSIEMVSIIFAVLLALGLEGWMQDRELTERANQMLVRVTAEIRVNRQELKVAVTENQTYVDGLMAGLSSDQLKFSAIAPFFKMSAGSTSNAAWSSAKMTNVISMMPVDTLNDIASIYDTQDYYLQYAQALMLQFADMSINVQNPDHTKDITMKFVTHLKILNSLAEQLNAKYDAFLSKEDKLD